MTEYLTLAGAWFFASLASISKRVLDDRISTSASDAVVTVVMLFGLSILWPVWCISAVCRVAYAVGPLVQEDK